MISYISKIIVRNSNYVSGLAYAQGHSEHMWLFTALA